MGTIDQLYLLTAEIEAARTFYEDGLGLDLEEVGETSVTYDTGGCELKLQQDFEPGVLAEFNLAAPPDADRGAGAIRVIVIDEPLGEGYDRLRRVVDRSPGKALTEPRDVPWGERMFLVRDPDGYVWEVCSAPGSECNDPVGNYNAADGPSI